MINKLLKLTFSVVIFSATVCTNANAQFLMKTFTPRYKLDAASIDGEDFVSKTIIFKVNPKFRDLCSNGDINHSGLKTVMSQLGVAKLEKIYPREEPPVRLYNVHGEKLVDLSLMFELTYTSNTPLQQALDKMAAIGIFEYAEPHFIDKLFYTVNDLSVGSQYHIAKIQAPQAWDINKGDTSMVIGITDTGTEPNHPDLKNNIKHNYADKIDGLDNDGDGYIDNFSGWDLAMSDNDPTWEGDAHGVHVSGIAAASTDNSIGVAGVGFKCKFLPVKIANAAGQLTASYTGIQYAAKHGCKVINCSWGGTSSSQYAQDIINFAVINSDAVVVVSAGNSGDETLQYPACYDNVISVANTTNTDARASTSSYNYKVQISAPGQSIYSTYSGTSYATLSGTSMASPCAAGAIAVIRSQFPTYTAKQAAARLMVTADNIFPPNSSLIKGKLGAGRVNLFRALNDPLAPFINMTTRTITDGNDNAPVALDTLRIVGIFTNLLAPTTNLTATLSVLTAAGYVTLVGGTTVSNLGLIPTMGTGNNNTTPFKVIIKATAPLNTKVTFQITYNDGTYTSYETFEVVVNVDYLNVNVNQVLTSVTSKGRDGWNNNPPTEGLGFTYKGKSLMYDGCFIIGVPDSAVSDMARGFTAGGDEDFISKSNIRRITTGALSDFDTEGYMNDSAAFKPLSVLIHHKSYAWSSAPDDKYIMYKYIIRNDGASSLSNMFAGIICDWDIQGTGGDSNRVSFDATNRMGYTYYTKASGYYAGIKLLSNTAGVKSYGYDNIIGGTGINPNAGFTNTQKYIGISTMRANAGLINPPGNDVMNSVSTVPLSLNVGDSLEVAFALIAGDNLADLKTSAVRAQTKYDNMNLTTAVSKLSTSEGNDLRTYPNPASGNAIVEVSLAQAGRIDLKLFNLIGQEAASIASGDFTSGKHQFILATENLTSGVYYYQLKAGEAKIVQRLVVTK